MQGNFFTKNKLLQTGKKNQANIVRIYITGMSNSSFLLLNGSHPERMHKAVFEHTMIPVISSVTTKEVEGGN